MKKIFLIFVLLSSSLLTSCASIVSHKKYNVTISSTPDKAIVSVADKHGNEIFSGLTPVSLELNSGSGFFQKAYYTITFAKKGYESKIIPLKASIDGWYFGNFIFGGPLGFLIVDPATGAMYKIEKEKIHETLIKKSAISNYEDSDSNIKSDAANNENSDSGATSKGENKELEKNKEKVSP